jgi:hypothetical protein
MKQHGMHGPAVKPHDGKLIADKHHNHGPRADSLESLHQDSRDKHTESRAVENDHSNINLPGF